MTLTILIAHAFPLPDLKEPNLINSGREDIPAAGFYFFGGDR
jgi:hypothetical protein